MAGKRSFALLAALTPKEAVIKVKIRGSTTASATNVEKTTLRRSHSGNGADFAQDNAKGSSWQIRIMLKKERLAMVQTTTKLTIEFPTDEWAYLELARKKQGLSMKEFFLRGALEKIEDYEDELLSEEAYKTLADIKSGKEKTSPLEEVAKRLLSKENNK